eukprot:gene8297-5814_t
MTGPAFKYHLSIFAASAAYVLWCHRNIPLVLVRMPFEIGAPTDRSYASSQFSASTMALAPSSDGVTVEGIDHFPTEEDWRSLAQKARDLESRIHSVQDKQHSYNAVLERSYVVEEAQRVRMQQLRDQVREEEVESLTNPEFAKWMKRQEETMATEKDLIGTWYKDDDLLALTPFAAVVPYPRYLTEMGRGLCEKTMDEFELPTLYVQTVAVKTPLPLVAQAVVPRTDHLLDASHTSKSDRGPLSYVAAPQSSATDVMNMAESSPLLRDALNDTSCLLMNDRRLTAAMCLKALVVRGRCAVAEVACTATCVPVFQPGHAGVEEEDGALLPQDVVAYALGKYVTTRLTPVLKQRTYEVLLLGHIKDLPTGCAAPDFWSRLQVSDVSFELLNLDYPDNSHFNMFTVEDLRSISGYVSRRDQRSQQHGVELPPAVRMVAKGGAPPLSATVALVIRQLERSADRYKAWCLKTGQTAPQRGPEEIKAEAEESDRDAAEGKREWEAAAPAAGGRLPATHMDPFVGLVSNATRLVAAPQRFFSEMGTIGKLLDATEERDLRPPRVVVRYHAFISSLHSLSCCQIDTGAGEGDSIHKEMKQTVSMCYEYGDGVPILWMCTRTVFLDFLFNLPFVCLFVCFIPLSDWKLFLFITSCIDYIYTYIYIYTTYFPFRFLLLLLLSAFDNHYSSSIMGRFLRQAAACLIVGAVAAGVVQAAVSTATPCLAVLYPQTAGLYGALGAAVALVFANLGSAYGAAKAGVGLSYLGLSAPDKIMRGIVPVVMAGILGIYGLIVAVIINNNILTDARRDGRRALSSLAAGLSIGVVGDTAVRAYGKQDQIFVAMVLMLIFSEALGLYGLIIALLMNNQANRYPNICPNAND